MGRGKAEGEMALLSEGSKVKESTEDKQVSVPCVRGSTLMWGAHIFCKIRAGARISRRVRIFCYTGLFCSFRQSNYQNFMFGHLSMH